MRLRGNQDDPKLPVLFTTRFRVKYDHHERVTFRELQGEILEALKYIKRWIRG